MVEKVRMKEEYADILLNIQKAKEHIARQQDEIVVLA
jgi:hypothetical protein